MSLAPAKMVTAVTGILHPSLLGHIFSAHFDKTLFANIMGSTEKDFESVLAEATTIDSKVSPGVVLLAVNKDGSSHSACSLTKSSHT